jgi:hypothetical protein
MNYYNDRPYRVYADNYEINGQNPYISNELVQRGYKSYAELNETLYYVCGIFACLLGGLPLYWFGCMFQRVEIAEEKINIILKKIQ